MSTTRSTRNRGKTRQPNEPASTATAPTRTSSRATTKAQQHQPQPKQTSARKQGKSGNDSGVAIVGRIIEVEWPAPGGNKSEYYQALVIGYNSRRSQHKVIYLEEESVEKLELDKGLRNARKWRDITTVPKDNLIGCHLKFVDNETGNDDSWFDFMRQYPNRKSPEFYVYIVSKIQDPNPEEVSGPTHLTANSEHTVNEYYRIIHAPNEYITTVDLACIDYITDHTLKLPSNLASKLPQQDAGDTATKKALQQEKEPEQVSEGVEVEGDQQPDPEQPDPVVRNENEKEKSVTADIEKTTKNIPVEEADEEDGKNDDTNERSRFRVTPTKSVDVIPDDENLPETLYNVEIGNATNENKVDIDPSPIAPSRVGRSTHTEPSSAEKEDVNDQQGEDEMDTGKNVEESIKPFDAESSPATQDTREDPLVSNANDSDILVTSKPSETTGVEESDDKSGKGEDSVVKMEEDNAVDSKVGDYISVDAGNGDVRKAYVEAYLPYTDIHFLAFCDDRGGTAQLKLTENNHTALDDKQAALLTRDQTRSKVDAVPMVDVDDMINGHSNMNVEDDIKPSRRSAVKDDEGPLVFDEDDEGNEAESKRRSSRSRSQLSNAKTKRERVGTSIAKKKRSSRSKWSQTSTGSTKRTVKRTSNKILGKSAGTEILSRCISVVWPNTQLVYVALVIGYSKESKQHMLLYMVDHCVEILELKFREWQLLPRGQEPWNSSGMVGKRIFVWWAGEYNATDAQRKAVHLFGSEDKTKVAYEAYVLSYIGQGVYKIVYPCNEDCEERELQADRTDGDSPLDKEWDILPEGINDVMGLPVIGWEN